MDELQGTTLVARQFEEREGEGRKLGDIL